MNSIIAKHKEFNIEEIIANNIFKCSLKNKLYIVIKLNPEDINYREDLSALNKLFHTNVSQPKLFLADKKQGYLVREWLDGVTVFDYILNNDFDENIYKQIFYNSYSARIAGINLDFNLKSWMIAGGKLYYTKLFCEKYNPNSDFTKKMIRKWFLSEDLRKYYENNGVLFDKSRIKEDYTVNKEMVLMTCKYYI